MRATANVAASPIGISAMLILLLAGLSAYAAEPSPLKLALFDFELEDASAGGVWSTSDAASDATRMQAVDREARQLLTQSGLYSLVDVHGVDAVEVEQKTLRTCGGCDADIALKLGAQRSFIGVVSRVAKTEYYVSVRMTDAVEHKVITSQMQFFTGADYSWDSGVRAVIEQALVEAGKGNEPAKAGAGQ